MNFIDAYEAIKEGQPVTLPDRSLFLKWNHAKETIYIKKEQEDAYDIRDVRSIDQTFKLLLRNDWELAQLPTQIETEIKVEQPTWWESVNFEPDEPKLLRLGDTGEAVTSLQQTLCDAGIRVDVDGIFGPGTETAVRRFQRQNGLVSDGIVGQNTADAFHGKKPKGAVKDSDIAWAAQTLKCEPAAILAVSEVESSGSGFFGNGKPKILFERHWMCRRLAHYDIDYRPHMRAQPNVVNTRSGGYQGGVAEYLRLAQAELIHQPSALESASWGAYQIMGFHWKPLGYDSATAFTQLMHESGSEHLKAFVRFIENDQRLVNAIRAKAWATFARIYNGPNYRKNQYDRKMATSYVRQVNGGANTIA